MAACSAALLLAAGCQREAPRGSGAGGDGPSAGAVASAGPASAIAGNVVPAVALEYRLPFDRQELQAYLEAFPRERYEVVEVPGVGTFLIDDNPALVKRTLKSGKPWEPLTLEAVRKHVVPGTTALDVGAHIGSITVPMARAVGPRGRVYAFEPQKKVFRELVHNLRLNGLAQATALRFAAGAKDEVIHMAPEAEHDGQTAVGAGGDEVELRTIDGFGFGDVSLVKIDVEGFEAEVLKGAAETIRRCRPVLIIEITRAHHYDELDAKEKARVDESRRLVRELGYTLTPLEADGHDFLARPAPPERR